MYRPSHRHRFVIALAGVALIGAACGSSDGQPAGATNPPSAACFEAAGLESVTVSSEPMAYAGTELTLVAYDSFVVSDGVFEQFEAQTGITVSVLAANDTGTMVSNAVLNVGNPVADVMWGIDNTSLCRALEADVFLPYVSAELGSLADDLKLDDQHRVTPVNFADQCVNYWISELDEIPTSLNDLRKPEYASVFVTENPESSAPGMGLLLATVATYGDGWEDYWRDLAANGVTVTPGWSEAYFGEFIAGGGDKSIVQSYASSPVAEVVFAEEPPETAPTGVLFDSCFRSIEFAGVLSGTNNPEAAALLVDFLASEPFQVDLPFNNFVYPANTEAELPPEFIKFGPLADDPLILAPDLIEANRADWTDRWTEIVLRS